MLKEQKKEQKAVKGEIDRTYKDRQYDLFVKKFEQKFPALFKAIDNDSNILYEVYASKFFYEVMG